jgi:hypothetical protein
LNCTEHLGFHASKSQPLARVLLQETSFALALIGKFCLLELSQITRGTSQVNFFAWDNISDNEGNFLGGSYLTWGGTST